MTDTTTWLQAELRRDLDALAGYGAREWAIAFINLVLAPALAIRAACAACVYAITHREPGAESGFSVVEPPLSAPPWTALNRLQTSALGVWLVAWFVTPFASLPADPVLAGVVALQSVALACDPVVAIWEVRR